MKKLYYIFLLFCAINVKAQYILSSNTSVQSCNELDSCLTVSNFSQLYYDDSKGEFFLKLDFGSFRPDVRDSINNWLSKEKKDTSLYFRAIFPKENFPVLTTESRKTYKLNGRVFYNNKWKDQVVEMTIYASQNSLTNNGSSSTNYGFENYKVNFSIPFVPSDFKVYKDPKYIDQTVNINVGMGRINILKPGMEPLLSEVYYQADH